MSLKWLLVASVVVAAVAFIAPWATYRFGGEDLAIKVMAVAIWPAIACLVLLVIGLFQARVRGLWLIIPLAVSLFWPLYVGISIGRDISDCQRKHPEAMCVP